MTGSILNRLLVTCLLPLVISAEFNATKCAFFCFTVPGENQRVSLNALDNTRCTHIVYGFAKIDESYLVTQVSRIDLPNYNYAGNYRVITNFKQRRPEAVILLGVRQYRDVQFTETSYSRDKLAESLVDQCKWNGFDGVYLDLDAELFKSFLFERFLETLNKRIVADSEERNTTRLMVVVSLGARNIGRVTHKLPTIANYVDYIYLVSDDVESADDAYQAAQLEPLYQSEHVPIEDTVSYNAEQLAESGVPLEKIVIGLSLWARSYRLVDVHERGHNAPARGYGQWDEDPRGRVPHKEICRQRKELQGLDVDDAAVTTSMLGPRQMFYSFNLNNHSTFDRKLNWISSHGFGGIGLYSIEADDAAGDCDDGPMPMHRFVGASFACSARRPTDMNSSACIRVCMLDAPHASQFTFDNLEAHLCSHIIVGPLNISPIGKVKSGENVEAILNKYRIWRPRNIGAKPKLLLSVGAEQSADIWRHATGNNVHRRTLLSELKQHMADHNADGLEIAWTNGAMDGNTDPWNLSNLLEQLRTDIEDKLLMLTVSPAATYAGRYEKAAILKAVDYIIVPGYRFHSPTKPITGHHSPLFSDAESPDNRKSSIQAFAGEWVGMQVPRAKLIIGISAVGIVQQFGSAQMRNLDNKLGVRATTSSRMLSSGGYASISEICELQKKRTAKTEMMPGMGVPIMVVDDDFVAFDSTSSISKKAVWISMNEFAGIAFHGLERDNAEGRCPIDVPFPLLSEVASAQVCPSCPISKSRSCHPNFRTVCYYRLPTTNDKTPMSPQKIPFPKCTDIVAEEIRLDENNELNYADGTAVDYVRKLVSLSPELEDRGLVLAVKFDMSKRHFVRLLDQRTPVIAKLAHALQTHHFSGLELRCAHLMQGRATRTKFTNFVNDLRMAIAATGVRCQRTISLRVPIWEKSLRENYEMTLLNHLHYVALEPFVNQQDDVNTTRVINPLMGRHSHANVSGEWSIMNTVSRWVEGGLRARSILLILPTYGISNQLADRNDNDQDSPMVRQTEHLSQSEICALMRNRNAPMRREILYEQVSTYAHSISGQWITYEIPETALYKVRYALRDHLAGVGFMMVNEDDVNNDCQMGAFPLLSVVPECRLSNGTTK